MPQIEYKHQYIKEKFTALFTKIVGKEQMLYLFENEKFHFIPVIEDNHNVLMQSIDDTAPVYDQQQHPKAGKFCSTSSVPY